MHLQLGFVWRSHANQLCRRVAGLCIVHWFNWLFESIHFTLIGFNRWDILWSLKIEKPVMQWRRLRDDRENNEQNPNQKICHRLFWHVCHFERNRQVHWIQVSFFCRFNTCFCFHILFNINKSISMISTTNDMRELRLHKIKIRVNKWWAECVKLLVDAMQQWLEFNFILLPFIFIVYKVYTIVIFTLWPKGKHNLSLSQWYCSSRNTMSAATSQFWYQNTISLSFAARTSCDFD